MGINGDPVEEDRKELVDFHLTNSNLAIERFKDKRLDGGQWWDIAHFTSSITKASARGCPVVPVPSGRWRRDSAHLL